MQLVGELLRVERTAREKSLSNFYRGDFTPALVDLDHKIHGVGVVLNVDLFEANSAALQKILGAPAIRAPGRAVHRDSFQGKNPTVRALRRCASAAHTRRPSR